MKAGVALALGAIGGLAIGGAAGYFFARRQLEEQFRLELDEAVEEVKEYYRVLRKEDYETPAEAVEKLVDDEKVGSKLVKEAKAQQAEILEQMAYVPPPEDAPKENVFEERNKRKPGLPYLIDQEEFMDEYSNEEGEVYDKIYLHWYDGDGVLCDDQDQIIPLADEIIGLDNMNRFGEGEDSMILHIRNEKQRADYEVEKNDSTYSEVVMGIVEIDEPPRKKKPKEE